MLEDVKAGPFDVARHEFGGPVGIACLNVGNKLTVIADDLRSPREGETEPAADRAKHLAMFPP
jgi:hypothetical protein